MPGQHRDRRLNRLGGRFRNLGTLRGEELEGSLQVQQGIAGIDYLRHGLGRAPFLPRASRPNQACTSCAAYTSPVSSMSRSAASASRTNASMLSSRAVSRSMASSMKAWGVRPVLRASRATRALSSGGSLIDVVVELMG